MASPKACMILTTCSGRVARARIIDALLDTRLAACIQVLPVQSHYVWRGKRQKSRESLLLIKARRSDFRKIRAVILERHDYEVPEIIGIEVSKVHPDYLKWLLGATA